jgi:hypothetical protein
MVPNGCRDAAIGKAWLPPRAQSPGEWRMLAVIANGQPAAAAYRRQR